MVSYTVKQTVVENLNADLDGKQPAGDYPTNASLTESLQSNLLNYTTNRILEIPQDIKLELNNGTLTLKAGSKVYVPNGFEADGTTPKFDEFIISNDVVDHDFGNSSKEVAFVMTKSDLANTISVWPGSQVVSGTSAPDFSSTGYWGVWYDTSNNIIKIQDGTNEWKDFRGFSLPICLVSSSSSAVTSLDQVFNGFGYIGSTVFALPGVKVQYPNGRNEDGTCNSGIIVNSKVNLYSATGTAYVDIVLLQNSIFAYTKTNLFYDSEKNLFKHKNGSIIYGTTIASCWNKNKVVSDFLRYDVDSVANSNASNFSQAGRSYLAGLGMPSDRYIDLTLGASGSTYTAPANGYFVSSGNFGQGDGYIELINNTKRGIGTVAKSSSNNWSFHVSVPCQKGDQVAVYYVGGANLTFLYAEGEN